MAKDARAIPLMAKEEGELESSNHDKNSIQVTISITTGLHETPNKQDWNSFNSSLSIPIIIPKGLMRKPVLHLIRNTDRQSESKALGTVQQIKLALKILGKVVREVDF